MVEILIVSQQSLLLMMYIKMINSDTGFICPVHISWLLIMLALLYFTGDKRGLSRSCGRGLAGILIIQVFQNNHQNDHYNDYDCRAYSSYESSIIYGIITNICVITLHVKSDDISVSKMCRVVAPNPGNINIVVHHLQEYHGHVLDNTITIPGVARQVYINQAR